MRLIRGEDRNAIEQRANGREAFVPTLALFENDVVETSLESSPAQALRMHSFPGGEQPRQELESSARFRVELGGTHLGAMPAKVNPWPFLTVEFRAELSSPRSQIGLPSLSIEIGHSEVDV